MLEGYYVIRSCDDVMFCSVLRSASVSLLRDTHSMCNVQTNTRCTVASRSCVPFPCDHELRQGSRRPCQWRVHNRASDPTSHSGAVSFPGDHELRQGPRRYGGCKGRLVAVDKKNIRSNVALIHCVSFPCDHELRQGPRRYVRWEG